MGRLKKYFSIEEPVYEADWETLCIPKTHNGPELLQDKIVWMRLTYLADQELKTNNEEG